VISANADLGGNRVNGATYIVDAAQLEVGAFATSPILTTFTTAQRFVDSPKMVNSDFTNWYNPNAGTFVAEWSDWAAGIGGAVGVMSVNDGSNANKFDIRGNTGISLASGGSGWTLSAGAPTQTLNKYALAYAAGSQAVSLNGATVVTATAATLPPGASMLNIGYLDNSLTSYHLNGHIRRLSYWGFRASDNDTFYLSSP
jgi:hypothetical protein